MRRLILTIIAAAAVLLIAGLAALIWFRYELNAPYYQGEQAEVFLEIPRHSNSDQVASILTRAGILRHRLPFILYLRYTNLGRRIQAGEYRFAEPATPKEVAQRLIRGDVCFRSVTIPEGLTAQETIDLLAKNGLGTLEEFKELLFRADLIRDFNAKAQNLEGYLFPETYRFSRKANPETVIRAMVGQFRTRIAKITEKSPVPSGWTVNRIVILASMIEKEVKRQQEGPIVASVFINRLEHKMPLACDATIIYAMKLAGTYEGRLSKTDMAMHSPYNSYLNGNLPPGPICSPGEQALRSALNPARTDYLYYVSRNDGTHQFSKNFASHQRAVERFQKSHSARRNARR